MELELPKRSRRRELNTNEKPIIFHKVL